MSSLCFLQPKCQNQNSEMKLIADCGIAIADLSTLIKKYYYCPVKNIVLEANK